MKLNFRYELNEEQQNQWIQFWKKCRHSYPRQHFLYAEIEKEQGRVPIFISGEINGSIVCLGIFSIRPLFFGKRFSLEAYCLRGPAFEDVSVFKTFMGIVIQHFMFMKVGSVRVSPYWQFPEARNVESVLEELGFTSYYKREGSRSNTGMVDLNRTESEIMASFSPKTRQHIRRIEKLDIEICAAKTLDNALLGFSSLCKMRSERGLTPMLKSEFSKMFESIYKYQDYGVCLNAFSKERILLGSLWIIRGEQVAIVAGYVVETEECNKTAGNLSIGPPLWWNGIQWAKEKGCISFDVEGYSDKTPEASYLYQIHKFKEKFRPQPIQIISEHICICCPFTHAIHQCYTFTKRGARFARSLPYQFKKRFILPKKQ
jgi:hypothetical protein